MAAVDPLGSRGVADLKEIVQLVEDDAIPDGHVKEVVQRGYTFRKRVLRPARVAVVKHPNPQQDSESEQEGEQDG